MFALRQRRVRTRGNRAGSPILKWHGAPRPPTAAKLTKSCTLADCSPPLASKRAQARPGPVSLFRSWIERPSVRPHRRIAGTGLNQRLTLALSPLRDALCRHPPILLLRSFCPLRAAVCTKLLTWMGNGEFGCGWVSGISAPAQNNPPKNVMERRHGHRRFA